MSAALLTGAVLAPPVVGGAAALLRTRSVTTPSVAAAATGASWLTVAVLAILAVAGAAPEAGRTFGAGALTFAATDVDLALLLAIFGISWIVQYTAVRSMRGDVRATRFALLAALVTSAAAATVVAGTLLSFAVAWTATSLLTALLIGLYRGYGAAEEGIRRTGRALLIGDVALWAAVLWITTQHGSVTISSLGQLPAAGTLETTIVAVLLLVAACARSVQVPFHGWLPATLASPTPVSALLHAGVVNAGAILLFTLAPLFTASTVATHLAVLIGGITAVVGTATMLTRPDIKGALAHSTVAQMGFMIATCGLGAWAAALIHLTAHGAYKAARFLGAGDAVREVRTHHDAGPLRWGGVAPAVIAGVVALVPLIAVGAWAGISLSAALLLIFAWAMLLEGGRGWLARHPGARGIGQMSAAIIVIGGLYALIVESLAHAIEPAIPAAAASLPSPWLLVGLAAALALTAAIQRAGGQLADRMYVAALTVGDGSRPPRRLRGPVAPLVIDPEGGRS